MSTKSFFRAKRLPPVVPSGAFLPYGPHISMTEKRRPLPGAPSLSSISLRTEHHWHQARTPQHPSASGRRPLKNTSFRPQLQIQWPSGRFPGPGSTSLFPHTAIRSSSGPVHNSTSSRLLPSSHGSPVHPHFPFLRPGPLPGRSRSSLLRSRPFHRSIAGSESPS